MRVTFGMTLAEVMISMGIFTLVATGIASTLIQIRKMAESNLSQVIAKAVAEGIIEQVLFIKYPDLSNTALPGAPIPLKFIAANSSNQAVIQKIDLLWAPDDTTFSNIGETDESGKVLGVLVDVEYRGKEGMIRPKRYLKMQVNLQREVDTTSGNVAILLTYKWQLPDRGNASKPVYITREMRTVKSKTASY